MATSTVIYHGNLRTECTHLASGSKITTDAPKDNMGKGECFSPTDLVATSLASCLLTIIGIYCQQHQIPFNNGNVEVTKEMTSNPRRIGKIILIVDLQNNGWDSITSQKIQKAGESCPVWYSINPDIVIDCQWLF